MRKPITYVEAAMMAGLIAQAPTLGGYAPSKPYEPRLPESSYTPEQKARRTAILAYLKAENPHMNRKARKQAARRVLKP